MLPETFEALLVPSVLAGIVWMFVALVVFRFWRYEFTPEQKQLIMAILTVISGGLVALVQVLPPETVQQLADVYAAVRPVLEFVLGTVLAGGAAYTTNQGAYRLYKAIMPDKSAPDPTDGTQESLDKRYPVVG